MTDREDVGETSATLQSEGSEQEDEMESQTEGEDPHADLSRTQHSFVHFCQSDTDSSSSGLLWSQFSSSEISLSYHLSSLQISEITISRTAPKSLKSMALDHFQSERSLGVNSLTVPKKKPFSIHGSETAVTGEGEDYFLSLFDESKKLTAQSFPTKKSRIHFSMILDEMSQSRSSAFGDIKIAEVKDLFVKLINSSLDKEVEIGNHILQQNVNGQRVSLYRFPPNIIVQANSTVMVWTAASGAKHQPPSDFVWKEEDKFRKSPNCTTILCKPGGEAIAWYTPLHWMQAWEKLETDIQFDRCSVVSATPQNHMFHWPKSTTPTKEDHHQAKRDTSTCQMEPAPVFLKRKNAVPPTLFPNRSPWCHSPSVPAHPYCPLIEPHGTSTAESGPGSSYSSSLNKEFKVDVITPEYVNGLQEVQESAKFGAKKVRQDYVSAFCTKEREQKSPT